MPVPPLHKIRSALLDEATKLFAATPLYPDG
jgi:hypothetical protein